MPGLKVFRLQHHIESRFKGVAALCRPMDISSGLGRRPIDNHIFTRADGQPMALAGLWDRWRSKDKSETKETFTIITTAPSQFAAQFHNRMPLILEPDAWDLWMKGEPDAAAALMKPANEGALISRLVSKAVNNVKNNAPELLEATQ